MKAYGGNGLDGDLEEEAGSLALSSFETGSWTMVFFLALKPKEPSQGQQVKQNKANIHRWIEHQLVFDRL